jgi:hypothetical protein
MGVQYVLVVAVDKTSEPRLGEYYQNALHIAHDYYPPYATVLLAQRPTASASPIDNRRRKRCKVR